MADGLVGLSFHRRLVGSGSLGFGGMGEGVRLLIRRSLEPKGWCGSGSLLGWSIVLDWTSRFWHTPFRL